MNRALVTLATGPHCELLQIARPSFEAFADRHGYELLVADTETFACERAPSWWKVPALLSALREHDEALFLDADTVIVDPTYDLDVPSGYWQALVRHETGDGQVPNCAVWFVRQPMIPVLKQAWEKIEWLDHGWWEQAAILELLGYQVRYPTQLNEPTELYERTFWLDPGWNLHKWDSQTPERRRIEHATMHDDRAAVMRQWATTGLLNAAGTPSEARSIFSGDIRVDRIEGVRSGE